MNKKEMINLVARLFGKDAKETVDFIEVSEWLGITELETLLIEIVFPTKEL